MSSIPLPRPLHPVGARELLSVNVSSLNAIITRGDLPAETERLRAVRDYLRSLRERLGASPPDVVEDDVEYPEPRHKREFPTGTTIGRRPTSTPCPKSAPPYHEVVEALGADAAKSFTGMEF